MILRFFALSLAFALTACATPTTDPAELPSGQWALDQGHASTVWRVRHMGLSWYTGRFDSMDARLDFSPSDPQSAQLTASIEAASISTGDREFDRVLADDWFNAQQHPQILFVSERIDVTGETTGRAHGQLSMNGRTAPTTLEIEFYGGLFNLLEGRNAIGFGADLVIDRTVFGIGNLSSTLVGEHVLVRIEAEFLREGS
ncbi:MAG: polyisoprenoid-binding protein [Alphaproteobacteria bacterium]|nr:polyisoprenoid-binding protein [Alphaproteobacteria bacterium]